LDLPHGYRLDMSDPDIFLLVREDGEIAGRFSALGADPGEIERAAWEDFLERSGEVRRGRRPCHGERGREDGSG